MCAHQSFLKGNSILQVYGLNLKSLIAILLEPNLVWGGITLLKDHLTPGG